MFIYALILGIGIMLAFFAVKKWQHTMHLLKTGERSTATVVEMISYRDSDGDVLYKPVFEYSTATGQKLLHTHNVGSRPASWAVGDTTSIIYDMHNPGNPKIATYFGLFGWAVVLLSIAAPCIIIGGGYFWASKFF
ncbi:MAG TPA: DUF3592 domain-containing protein [Chitinophagaceae bacterium]|nr:DUF3592 domain-containing protein [Chitinophagaceae bacterium]